MGGGCFFFFFFLRAGDVWMGTTAEEPVLPWSRCAGGFTLSSQLASALWGAPWGPQSTHTDWVIPLCMWFLDGAVLLTWPGSRSPCLERCWSVGAGITRLLLENILHRRSKRKASISQHVSTAVPIHKGAAIRLWCLCNSFTFKGRRNKSVGCGS